MRPETQYARSGEVHIAYQVLGEGPLDLVVCPGFASHLESAWDLPGYPTKPRHEFLYAGGPSRLSVGEREQGRLLAGQELPPTWP